MTLRDPAIGTVRQVFDADGRVAQVGYPGGESVHYGYSARGEVTRVRDPAVAAIAATTGDWQLGYDALGRPVRERGPFGVERRTDYTVEGFVESVELHSATALVETYTYSAHDALGNPGQIDRNGTVTAIQYDPRSRVEKVAYPGGSLAACLTSCERFAYDRAGNRVTHAENGLETTYVVDADDRLTAILDASAQTVATFTHDAAGRRTSRTDAGTAASTYAYDSLGRLRQIQEGGFWSTLEYTATDERTSRVDVFGTAHYLGEWYETTPSTGRRLVHGPGIDNVLGQVSDSDQLTFLLRDGTANVVTTAQDGTFANNSRKYEAFGGVRGGPLAVERGFAGRPAEGLTSLINVRARHYDPETGRFLQRDPLGVAADQLYAYAASNPYRFWDPLGLEPGLLSDFSLVSLADLDPVESQGGNLQVLILNSDPDGGIKSTWGHAATHLVTENEVHSYGSGGWLKVRTLEDYLFRNKTRDVLGLELSLNAQDLATVRSGILADRARDPRYGPLGCNCTDALESGLESIGFKLGINVTPYGLGEALIRSGRVTGINYYPATAPGAVPGGGIVGDFHDLWGSGR